VFVGMAVAELGSAAPTSGGVSSTNQLEPSSLLITSSCISGPIPLRLHVGRRSSVGLLDVCEYLLNASSPAHKNASDSNTVGSVAGVASIDWGCAVQIMAAATIGSNGRFEPSAAQL
jgi:hypothetical protein